MNQERIEKLADLVRIVVDDYAAAQKRICELESALEEIESIRGNDCDVQAIIDRVDGKGMLCCIEKTEQIERQQVDCDQCANRGRVKGASQESYCSHCIHQEKWRVDHFVGRQE